MRMVYQLGFMMMTGGLLSLGLWFSNVYLIVLALTLGYLCISLLRSRFIETRSIMLEEAVQSSGMRMDEKALYFPFSNDEGLYILKSEEKMTVLKIGKVKFQIKKLNSYPLVNSRVEKLELEKKYMDYIFISRTALHFTTFLSLVYASYYIYMVGKYAYLVIPLGILLCHFIFYSQVTRSATEISLSKKLNKDREYLHELMRFYGVAVLGLENPTPITEVMVTGAILVRFEDTLDTPYYYMTFEERFYLEMTAEEMTANVIPA